MRIAEAVVASASGDKHGASAHLVAAIRTGREQSAYALQRRARAVAAKLSIPL